MYACSYFILQFLEKKEDERKRILEVSLSQTIKSITYFLSYFRLIIFSDDFLLHDVSRCDVGRREMMKPVTVSIIKGCVQVCLPFLDPRTTTIKLFELCFDTVSDPRMSRDRTAQNRLSINF